jgi:hypothetical protein
MLTEVPEGSPAYLAASGAMDAIDALAEVLVGERGHFYFKLLDATASKRRRAA